MRREYSKKPFLPNILVFCRARVMSPPGYHYAAGLVICCRVAFTHTTVYAGGDVRKAITCMGLHFICTKCFLRQKVIKRSVWLITSLSLHLGHAVSLTNNTYTVLRCRNNYILGTCTFVLLCVFQVQYYLCF